MDLASIDLESRVDATDHQALRLWLRLLACTTRVESVIRNRLRSEFATTLPRFDLMAQLEREPEGLSMDELSQRLMVTGGNVTGITDQLEGEGLVVRAEHPSDRRAYRVCLTAAGRRQFRRMAATHEAWIVDALRRLVARTEGPGARPARDAEAAPGRARHAGRSEQAKEQGEPDMTRAMDTHHGRGQFGARPPT